MLTAIVYKKRTEKMLIAIVFKKRKCFAHKKLFTIGNKTKMADAPYKLHPHGFPRQRQCGGHSCTTHVATGNKGMMVGQLL